MLYYVDLCKNPVITEFVPRIPIHRMSGENNKIPRICLAKSIEGCLTATPWGSIFLCDRMEYEVFRVYEFDETKINGNNILNSRALYNGGYVDDAIYSKEVWIINQNLKPDKMYYIQIEYFDTENYDFISFKEKKRNYKSYINQHVTVIKQPKIIKLDEAELFFGKELHPEDLNFDCYSIERNLPIEVEFDYDEDNGTIYFEEDVVIHLQDLVV